MHTNDGSRRRRLGALVAAAAALSLITGLGGIPNAASQALLTGEDSASQAAADGRWLDPIEGDVPAIHMSLRPDGTVAYYGGNQHHETDDNLNWSYFTATLQRSRSRVMDLDDGSVAAPTDDPTPDLFCSGPTTLPDGTTMTVGGSNWIPSNKSADGPVLGHERAYEVGLDASSSGPPTWEAAPSMENRRWYPTALTLPDGSTGVFSGIRNLTNPATNVVAVDVLEPGAADWQEIEPDLQLADGVTVEHQGRSGDAEKAPVNLPMYPRLFVVPGGPLEGDVFYASNGDLWGEFGERPAEEPLWGMYQSFDRQDGTWRVHGASAFGARHLGSTVPLMLDPGGPDGNPATTGDNYAPTLLTFGGTLQRSTAATPTAETVTLDTTDPTPTVVEPMEEPRWQPQGHLLPTGEVAAIGGTKLDTTVLHGQKVPHAMTVEAFDPATGTWETWAEMDVPRGYHSTSVLTPNGTILTGGHVPNPNPFTPFRKNNVAGETPTHEDDHTPLNQTQTVETRFEEMVPPYLVQPGESRPAIETVAGPGQAASAPGEHPADLHLDHGDSFTVTVSGLDEGIQDVVLLRTGSATHGLHADQRGVRLGYDVVSTDGDTRTLSLTAPPDGAVAPPGHYMLFVNEDAGEDGYPSKAAWVGLGIDDVDYGT